MSIQNIETTQYTSGSGVKIEKQMLPGSLGLLMDLVQKTQYSSPQKSTVRELAANGEDSLREKAIAISILKGESVPEDYFVVKDDMESERYSESKWDPSYYSLDHLNPEDVVSITYIVNDEKDTGFCDRLEIFDTGVGLSLKRIIITSMLGQSTKRLNKALLGAYGFGAKAALSTDCGYYDLYSVYNGKRFAVRCFERHIEDLTPLKNNFFIENEKEEYEGITLRYTKTNEYNSVRIIVPSRRVSKEKYIEAVEEQLLYFNHISFKVIEKGNGKEIPVKATILLETDYFVISDQDTYRKPHILITADPKARGENMVCYGYIDFEAMEYPQTYGSIGIKCPIYAETIDPVSGKLVVHSGVTVTPSREMVRQGDNATRNFIRDIFTEKVKREAQEYVEKTLNSIDDVTEWLKTIRDLVNSRGGSNSGSYIYREHNQDNNEKILSVLSKIIDFKTLSFEFKDTGITYRSSIDLLFPNIKIMAVRKKSSKRVFSQRLSKYVERCEIERTEVVSTSQIDFDKNNWYIKAPGEPHNHVKDKFLLTKTNIFYTFEYDKNAPNRLLELMVPEKMRELLESTQEYQNVLVESKFEDEEVGVEEDILEAEKFERMSPAEKRKLANLVLVTTFQASGKYYWDIASTAFWSESTKMEITLQELNNLEGRVYYLFEEDIRILRFIFTFCKELVETRYSDGRFAYYSDEIKFIKVSREVAKTLTKAKYITEFFNQIENGKFVMDPLLKTWNTARIINENLPRLIFLRNFAVISPTLQKSYEELKKYSETHYWSNSDDLLRSHRTSPRVATLSENLIGILDKLFELQELAQDQPEELLNEILGEKFKNSFGVQNAEVVDYEKIVELRKLLEFADGVHHLLNCHALLTARRSVEFSDEEVKAIKDYINFKKQTVL